MLLLRYGLNSVYKTAFRKAKRLPKASIAHERALQWRDVFEIAHTLQMPEDDLDELASRMAGW